MKDEWVYLQHILDETGYLAGVRSIPAMYENFVGDKMLCRAVTRSFEIIGEAAKNVPDPVRTALSGNSQDPESQKKPRTKKAKTQ